MKVGVFTVHKSASMLLYKLMRKINDMTGVEYYSANNINLKSANDTLKPFDDFNHVLDDKYSAQYNSITEGIIGPIRTPLNIDKGHNVIVMLREPKDILNSMWFSFTSIHGGIEDKERARRLAGGIEQFITDRTPLLLEKFDAYFNLFIGKENVIFLKYEDMFKNPNVFISNFVSCFELSGEQRNDLINFFKAETSIEGANAKSHKRKMLPGDYINNLNDETIAMVNNAFSNYIHYFK